jgi:hypothetical protein
LSLVKRNGAAMRSGPPHRVDAITLLTEILTYPPGAAEPERESKTKIIEYVHQVYIYIYTYKGEREERLVRRGRSIRPKAQRARRRKKPPRSRFGSPALLSPSFDSFYKASNSFFSFESLTASDIFGRGARRLASLSRDATRAKQRGGTRENEDEATTLCASIVCYAKERGLFSLFFFLGRGTRRDSPGEIDDDS